VKALLEGEKERLARGHQAVDARALLNDGLYELPYEGHHVLAVVQHEQQPSRPEHANDGLAGGLARVSLASQCSQHGVRRRNVCLADVSAIDEQWMSGTNSRGQLILARRDLMRTTVPAG
jgi:hypothetical protein